MRTEAAIKANIALIHETMVAIKKQISLLEEDYQPNAIEITGERIGSWDDMIENLEIAWKNLNTMRHMEYGELDYMHDQNEED